MPDHPLSRRIADVLSLEPTASAIEYDGQWSTWGEVAGLANRIAAVGETEVGMRTCAVLPEYASSSEISRARNDAPSR